MATVHPVTDVLGRVAWEAFPGMVFEGSPYVEHYYRAMDEGIPGEFEAAYGEPINIIVRVQVRPSMDGIVVFFRDVTNQKKSAEALIRTEKLAAVGRLAASIAHEINNPLEAVTNLLYLARGNENADEVQSYLKTAEQELQRVSVIANQTLRFNKQATNPIPIVCEDWSIVCCPSTRGGWSLQTFGWNAEIAAHARCSVSMERFARCSATWWAMRLTRCLRVGEGCWCATG